MNETEIAGGSFVVAGGQTTGTFELVEAAFDTVPQGICDGIDKDGFLAVDLAGYDGRSATLPDDTSNAIAVVATVCDEHPGLGKFIIDQHVEAFEVGDLTASYFRPDRQSVSVGNEVDLGREATF